MPVVWPGLQFSIHIDELKASEAKPVALPQGSLKTLDLLLVLFFFPYHLRPLNFLEFVNSVTLHLLVESGCFSLKSSRRYWMTISENFVLAKNSLNNERIACFSSSSTGFTKLPLLLFVAYRSNKPVLCKNADTDQAQKLWLQIVLAFGKKTFDKLCLFRGQTVVYHGFPSSCCKYGLPKHLLVHWISFT